MESSGNIRIQHSPVRNLDVIPGVLDLKTNKTYGRERDGKRRLLYRVVPDDTKLPIFLVPYEQKNMGFSKVFVNMYVLFRFSVWDDKHPIGVMTSTIGAVDLLPNFYEYQLYCRSLHSSIQRFNKATVKGVTGLSKGAGMDGLVDKYAGCIEDRRGEDWNVFTIDPDNSVDFDDGFSIKETDKHILVSVYIANVTILLDVMNLWESFSKRVSTIYLPDRKRPMLPSILSDNLCSLQEKCTRFAMTMDVYVDKHTTEILDVQYKNCAVRVSKNFRYEEPCLMEHGDYLMLEKAVLQLSKKYKYIRAVHNSHEVVCYLMTMMNYYCAKNLLPHREGLFRNSLMKNENFHVPQNLPVDAENFIKIWYSSGGQYVNASTLDENVSIVRHELMDMDAYIHITSPIRRLVDLLNMIKFQEANGLITLSEQSKQFYDHWTSTQELEYINVTMRSIKKIQSDCSILEFYTNNTDAINGVYDGIMFDKVLRHDGMYKYVVYLSALKLTLRVVVSTEYSNFECKQFKLFLFQDEDTLKKKIRLHLVEP